MYERADPPGARQMAGAWRPLLDPAIDRKPMPSDMAARTSRGRSSRLAAAPGRLAPIRASSQAAEIAEHRRQQPAGQGSRLIQRVGLLLQRRDSAPDRRRSPLARRVPGNHLCGATDDHLVDIAADQHLAMAEPCGDGVIGAAIAHQRQRTDPPRALVAGVVGDCGKALKNRTIPFQAFADRLVVATQLFRPSLGTAGFKMRVEIRSSGTLASAPGSSGGNSRRSPRPCPCRSPCRGGQSGPRTGNRDRNSLNTRVR